MEKKRKISLKIFNKECSNGGLWLTLSFFIARSNFLPNLLSGFFKGKSSRIM